MLDAILVVAYVIQVLLVKPTIARFAKQDFGGCVHANHKNFENVFTRTTRQSLANDDSEKGARTCIHTPFERM